MCSMIHSSSSSVLENAIRSTASSEIGLIWYKSSARRSKRNMSVEREENLEVNRKSIGGRKCGISETSLLPNFVSQ